MFDAAPIATARTRLRVCQQLHPNGNWGTSRRSGSAGVGIGVGQKNCDGTMMRWHCIVRGKQCRRDVPGREIHGSDPGSCSTMADDVLGEYNGELGVTVLLGVWSRSFGRVSGVYQFWWAV